jgi:hypothetical protein
MLSGIYSVKFNSSSDSGLGIAVFDNGKVHGADFSYIYKGRYNLDEKTIRAEIFISQYQDIQDSVFGPLNNFTLVLIGYDSYDSFELTGYVDGQPLLSISIVGKKLSELAT